ncbi:MAG: helix-turn-helix domain-containing protein, partial [Thermodesulfobacteriota bacterium]
MAGTKQDKTKIVQIWGEILDEGFTSVPNILLRYRTKIGLKPKHIMLIIDIMSYKWDAGHPFPSYSALSKRSGIEERSVKRITQDLEELGLLVKTPRFDEESGAQVTTVFDFRPLVEKLIEEMNKEGEVHYKAVNMDSISKKSYKPTSRKVNKNRVYKGDDENVTGEGDKKVTRGVTE